MTDVPIRDAATIILLRNQRGTRSVLMGQRGAQAAFMPDKFVFPGGAVDPGDDRIPLAAGPLSPCAERLLENSERAPHALAAAAIRELWEETGQILGQPGDWPAPPEWAGFARRGFVPDASALKFVFRAVTPPGRPRRFDARFFLADADALATDPDDLSPEHAELNHLQWIPLSEVANFNLPFITEVVLAEIVGSAHPAVPPDLVPYFHQETDTHLVDWLGRRRDQSET